MYRSFSPSVPPDCVVLLLLILLLLLLLLSFFLSSSSSSSHSATHRRSTRRHTAMATSWESKVRVRGWGSIEKRGPMCSQSCGGGVGGQDCCAGRQRGSSGADIKTGMTRAECMRAEQSRAEQSRSTLIVCTLLSILTFVCSFCSTCDLSLLSSLQLASILVESRWFDSLPADVQQSIVQPMVDVITKQMSAGEREGDAGGGGRGRRRGQMARTDWWRNRQIVGREQGSSQQY